MKKRSEVAQRLMVACLTTGLAVGFAWPSLAAESILGTIENSGSVWVARPGEDWHEFQKVRPIVTGDRLRTGKDGYLIADLGSDGVLGMFASTEVRVTRSATGVVVSVGKGKVAFHLGADAGLSVVAADSLIRPDRSASEVAAHGYVKLSNAGDAVIVLEEGAAAVVVEGEIKRLRAGQRLLVSAPDTKKGGRLVAEAPASEEEASRKAAGILRVPETKVAAKGAAEVAAGGATSGSGPAATTAAGLSRNGKIALGALGVVALAVGIGSAGGGGGSNGSP